jgi:hypothetical protein
LYRKRRILGNIFGYCAAKDEHYYGFKEHVRIDLQRRVVGFTLTVANTILTGFSKTRVLARKHIAADNDFAMPWLRRMENTIKEGK